MAAALLVALTTLVPLVVFNGSNASALEPWEAEGWTQVSADFQNTCAVTSSQALYCWGSNSDGQLGSSTVTYSSPLPVAAKADGALLGKSILSMDVGVGHVCVIASDNNAYCWGRNEYGQLGNNSTATSADPVAVDTTGVMEGAVLVSISVSQDQSCAISDSGHAYCWGANYYGQLGNNSTTNSPVPVAVNTNGALQGKTIKAIDAGLWYTCAIASDNQAYCWGNNGSGQFGDNSIANSSAPVAVDTTGVLQGKTVLSLSAGSSSTCAIASDNQAYCWGNNNTGKLGDNTTFSSTVPVAVNKTGVLAGKTVKSISTGYGNACVIASDDQAYCWGRNDNNQLGNNSTANSLVPVAIDTSGALRGKTVQAISVGLDHACVIASDDQVYCWGDNNAGQLGNGMSTGQAAPAAIGYHPQPRHIDGVTFSQLYGKKVMIINGSGFLSADELTQGVFFVSTVAINGVALPVCTDGMGMSAEEVADMIGDAPWPIIVSETPTCTLAVQGGEGGSPENLLTSTQAIVWLGDDFNTAQPGVVSVNGFDMSSLMQGTIILNDYASFAYNQPTGGGNNEASIKTGNNPLTNNPTITKKPTFNGTAPPGSTVVVTVNSDPVTCTTIADSNGNWSCTLPAALPPGQHTVTVVVTAVGGEVTNLGPFAVTVDGENPTVLAPPNTGISGLLPSQGTAEYPEQRRGLWFAMTVGSIAVLGMSAGILALRRRSAHRS